MSGMRGGRRQRHTFSAQLPKLRARKMGPRPPCEEEAQGINHKSTVKRPRPCGTTRGIHKATGRFGQKGEYNTTQSSDGTVTLSNT